MKALNRLAAITALAYLSLALFHPPMVEFLLQSHYGQPMLEAFGHDAASLVYQFGGMVAVYLAVRTGGLLADGLLPRRLRS